MSRRIDRTLIGMANVNTVEELEIRFIAEATKILPADCIGWNNWAVDWSGLNSNRMNDEYNDCFNSLSGVFAETIARHPVIAADQITSTTDRVVRMSDFEGYGKFKNNPLFLEVYRHLDSHFQLSYAPCLLSDRRIVLTWNRRSLEFSEQDRQLLHFMGLRLDVISRRIEEKLQLEKSWRALVGFIDARMPTPSLTSLGEQDGKLLAGLMKQQTRIEIARESGIRRDSLDKRLGSIRERLGLENHHQLLSALAELKKTKR
jgi:hypothetical protein